MVFPSGRTTLNLSKTMAKNSTDAADEVPVKPSVTVKYTQLLIDGKFVDAASGNVDEFGLQLAKSPKKKKKKNQLNTCIIY